MPENTSAYVYEVIATGVVLSQETINRFFYAGSALIADMDTFIDGVQGVLLSPITGCMNTNASFLNILVQQVKGGSQFSARGVSLEGTNGGDCLPPYACWDFTLVRGGARERNGYKRIAGVSEGNQSNGIATSGISAALNTAADAMFDNISDGTTDYTPVIQRKRINRVTQPVPKYYDISAVVYSKIGTQNSRKYGHGR